MAIVEQHHRADVVGRVSWGLLQVGGAPELARLATWLLVRNKPEVAAAATEWLVVAAGADNDNALRGIAMPMTQAVADAVDKGAVNSVVNASDTMVAKGLGGLLRLVNTELVARGRTDVASSILQHAIAMGKAQLLAVLGGELVANGDLGGLAKIGFDALTNDRA